MYVMLIANCIRCNVVFSCNPNLVPTVRINSESEKEPICQSCYEAMRQLQRENNWEVWPEMNPAAWEPGEDEGIKDEYDWEADLYGEYDDPRRISDKPNPYVNRESDKQEYDPYEPF